jgi:hypothetical protein
MHTGFRHLPLIKLATAVAGFGDKFLKAWLKVAV